MGRIIRIKRESKFKNNGHLQRVVVCFDNIRKQWNNPKHTEHWTRTRRKQFGVGLATWNVSNLETLKVLNEWLIKCQKQHANKTNHTNKTINTQSIHTTHVWNTQQAIVPIKMFKWFDCAQQCQQVSPVWLQLYILFNGCISQSSSNYQMSV